MTSVDYFIEGVAVCVFYLLLLLSLSLLQFVELDEREDGNAIRYELSQMTGRTSVPQIWIDGEYIGGYNDGSLFVFVFRVFVPTTFINSTRYRERCRSTSTGGGGGDIFIYGMLTVRCLVFFSLWQDAESAYPSVPAFFWRLAR